MVDDPDFFERKGTGRKEIDATPVTRDLFRSYIHSGYNFVDAVAEYVDNSLQQAIGIPAANAKQVTIEQGHDGSKFYISITDDSGGIRRDDAVRMIRPGASGFDAGNRQFSLFGVGGKAAGLSVAKRVLILSKADGDSGFKAMLDRDEIESKTDWKFETFDLPVGAGLRPGQTRIYLYDIVIDPHARFPDDYVKNFRKRYAFVLGINTPRLRLGHTEVSAYDPLSEMLGESEAPDGCGPRTFHLDKTYILKDPNGESRRETVTFEATVGLLPSRSTIGEAGALIYCNDRLLGWYNELGLQEGFELSGKRVHPESDRAWLRAIVTVRGAPKLLPWTYRKDGLNPSSESYGELRRFLKASYEAFRVENIGPCRTRVREALGTKEFPDILELEKQSYVSKLKSGTMKPATVRLLIQNSDAFIRARELAKRGTAFPTPPEKPTLATIAAKVTRSKVDEAKRIVRGLSGKEDVKQSDVVRYSLDHFISCLGKGDNSTKEG